MLQVTLLLSTYILSHKEKFFDSRNIKLAIVAGDPLGEAFGVQAFHRCQVNNLLKSQLIPLQSNGSTDIKAEVRSTGSSGVNVSISEMSVPVTSKLGEARPPADLTGSDARSKDPDYSIVYAEVTFTREQAGVWVGVGVSFSLGRGNELMLAAMLGPCSLADLRAAYLPQLLHRVPLAAETGATPSALVCCLPEGLDGCVAASGQPGPFGTPGR